MMRSKCVALLVICLALLSLMACGIGQQLDDNDAEDMLQKAFEKSKLWKSFSINTLTYVSAEALSEADAAAYTEYSTTGDILLEPLIARIVVSMQLADMSNAMTITQYLEESEKGIDVYQEVSSAWLKYEMVGENLQALIGVDPMENLAMMVNYIDVVTYEGEEIQLGRSTYKIKVVVDGKMFMEQIKKGQELGLSSYIAEIEALGANLDEIGTLVYDIYINKETGEISRYECNMSQIINTLAKKMLEAGVIDEAQGNQLLTAKMVLKVDVYNQNKVEKFDVPANIKESAQKVDL